MPTNKQMYYYGSAALGIVGLGLIMLSGGGGIFGIIGGIFAGLGSLFAVLFLKYGYILIPFITERTKIILWSETGYEVPESQDVIVKKVGDVYYASAFMVLKITESASDKSSQENIYYNEQFERALGNLKYVTKISMMTYVEDITAKRRDIETRRGELQLRISRERDKEQPDPILLDKMERELQMWDARLNDLLKGLRPMGVMAFAMTTASALSKDAAIAAVRSRVSEVKSVIGNALNVDVEQLKADDMLKCFEWEKFLPVTPQDLEDQVI
ncbi:MAG: hypothetical protein QW035_04555 [Candidatus Anstonellales archaeon]